MFTHHDKYLVRIAAMVVLVVIPVAGCRYGATVTPTLPSPPLETLHAPPISTTTHDMVVPTAAPVSDTDIPDPTATPVPPVKSPTPDSVLDPSSIAGILGSLEGLPIDAFLENAYRQLQLRDPDSLIGHNLAIYYDAVLDERFTNMSADYTGETQELERGMLALLRNFAYNTLTADQKISYDVFEWYLAMQVRGQAFTDYKFLVNPVWGLQNWPTDFLMALPLENKQDAENYIARLASLDIWAAQVMDGLERSQHTGTLPPRFVIENTISQLDALLKDASKAEEFELYTNFREKIRQISELSQTEQQTLLSAARAAIEETYIPAYQALRETLDSLRSFAVEDPNQWKLPGGQAYYAYLLAYHTGTDLTADEIHALGLSEVTRLQAEIWEAAAALDYDADGSMAALNQWMAEASQVMTGDALQRTYESILSASMQAAEDYFDLRANAGLVMRTLPAGPPAYYNPPGLSRNAPGEMRVNLDISPLQVNYNAQLLVHHEAIPGHHTQLALAQELDLPAYQRFYLTKPHLQVYDFQAYVEGWAWYAEGLAWEMELYAGEPLANLGRLRQSLLRTARMVADTGIHGKGWSLDEAAAYLEEVTGFPQSYASMTRYLVNPGYACGYTTGYLKIREMRQRAMEILGDTFDIKAFHNAVLGNGIVPLDILERQVNAYIVSALAVK